MGRVLALDLGEKRVGVAISDPLGWTAQGLPTLARSETDRESGPLDQLILEHEVERLVVGLPLRLDGSEGTAALAARRCAAVFERRFSLPVELWDERLTTAEADHVMRLAGVNRRRRQQASDRLAATLLLQSWLDARRGAA